MIELAEKIVDKLGLQRNLSLKAPIRGKLGYTVLDLICAIISTDNIVQAGELLGYSEGPIKQSIRLFLLPKFPSKYRHFGEGTGSSNWRYSLLEFIEHKFCSDCRSILPFNNFGSHVNHDSTNLNSYCARCHLFHSKLKKKIVAIQTPLWADVEKIHQIYLKCPKGQEVDHIVPLNGRLVSGLHVETNLQYLTKEQNRIKSNKFSG